LIFDFHFIIAADAAFTFSPLHFRFQLSIFSRCHDSFTPASIIFAAFILLSLRR